MFDVTEDCIRKDLKNLEKTTEIKRIYGGAVLARESFEEHDIRERKEINLVSKKVIAQKAFDLIEDRDTIFLDISSTNIILANLLADSNKYVTVVTNTMDILNILGSKKHNLNVVSVGGGLNIYLGAFVGAASIEFICRYKFDKAFIGSCGVDIYEGTLTTLDLDDGLTKSAIIDSSKKSYLVIESKKFNVDGNYKFAHLDDINCIICEETPSEEILDALSDLNIPIL